MSEQSGREPVAGRLDWLKWPATGFAFGGYFLLRQGWRGPTAFDVGLTGFAIAWAAALWLASNRPRPRRTAYYVVLASVMLGALFVGMPATQGASLTMGVVAWAGVTLLIAIWGVYWERS